VQEYVVVTMGTEGICVRWELSCSGVEASYIPGYSLSVPLLRRPIAGITPRRPGFDARPSNTGTGFSAIASVFALQYQSTSAHSQLDVDTALMKRTSGRRLRTLEPWAQKYFRC